MDYSQSIRSSIVNAIDFVIQCPRMSIHFKGQLLNYDSINAFINVLLFPNDMELDIQLSALSFLLTLRHNSAMWFSNFNPESIVTRSNFLWELAVRGIPSIETISGLYLVAEACNSNATLGMYVTIEYGFVSSA